MAPLRLPRCLPQQHTHYIGQEKNKTASTFPQMPANTDLRCHNTAISMFRSLHSDFGCSFPSAQDIMTKDLKISQPNYTPPRRVFGNTRERPQRRKGLWYMRTKRRGYIVRRAARSPLLPCKTPSKRWRVQEDGLMHLRHEIPQAPTTHV